MKERLKHTQLSFISGILLIVGLFAAIILTVTALSYIASILSFPYMQYAEYVLFILFVTVIVRKWITEYEYWATEDALFIDVYTGQRQKRVFSVSLRDIKHIGTRLPAGFKGKVHKFTYKSGKSGGTYIICGGAEKQVCVYFSPSKKMLSYIESARESEKAKQ